MSETAQATIRWSYYYACRYLVANGPASADMVGAVVWKDKKRGKTTSSGGGGDYAAQMLLGRMRKAGLVRHAPSDASPMWYEPRSSVRTVAVIAAGRMRRR